MVGKNDQALGLDLPVAPGMLHPQDLDGYRILDSRERLDLNTGYFTIQVHKNYTHDRTETRIATQLELDSRPAFEVLCIRTGADEQVRVLLIEKQRAENAFHAKGALPFITKIPGGYDHSGGGVSLEFIFNRILGESGIAVETQHLHCIGIAVGHTEIRTPIGLWWCDRWERIHEPRQGVTVLDVTLEEALTMADNSVQRVPDVKRIENETGVELLYLFDRLLRRGAITLHDAIGTLPQT